VRSQADNEEWKDLDDHKYDAAGNASNNSGRKTLDLKYSREINWVIYYLIEVDCKTVIRWNVLLISTLKKETITSLTLRKTNWRTWAGQSSPSRSQGMVPTPSPKASMYDTTSTGKRELAL
jgi:hypothetical protein